jgi:hypothetical protein
VKSETVLQALLRATGGLTPTNERKPWDHGWGVESYRRSEHPVMSGPSGPLTLSGSALDDFEEAVTMLLRDQGVRVRWGEDELWPLVGSLIATARERGDREAFISRELERVRTVGPSVNVLLASNVTWKGVPLVHSDFVIGEADESFLQELIANANGRVSPDGEQWREWFEGHVSPRIPSDGTSSPVAFACWTPSQGSRGRKDAERYLEDLIALCLLLEADLSGHEVFRRGPANRPGVRGLTFDRGALDRGLVDAARLELASFPLVVSEILSVQSHVEWFGVEPVPLGSLLAQAELRALVLSCLERDFLSRTVRLSARWFAEAFFTLARDDAALALGVALDALLSGEAALGSAAMADRYALLGVDPEVRKQRRKEYQRSFSIRSAVAHGGTSSKLQEESAITEYIQLVQDAAHRTLAIRDVFAPASGRALDEVYDDLRLGIRLWPSK